MRLLNLLLTALAAAFAVLAGLFVAALVAVAGSAFLLLRRFKRPAVAAGPSRGRGNARTDSDVIEVTATEVAAEQIGPPRT